MKFTKLLFMLLVVGVLYLVPGLARASYMMFPAATGIVDDYYNDCEWGTDGTVASGGGICYIYFPIPLPSGSTLSSVIVYYYDNSGSQSILPYLKRVQFSSDSYSTLDSDSDYTTSASVQSLTLSYGSSMSSSYAYYVVVTMSSGTELRGIRIYY